MPSTWVSIEVEAEFRERIDESLIERAATMAIEVGLQHDARRGIRRLISGREALQLSILVTVDAEIHRLNREYRSVDKPTDVLSFSLLEDSPSTGGEICPSELPLPLGDVVLSYPFIERQAGELGHSVEKELAWLVIHGTLQLLGYGHANEVDGQEMETLEQQALSGV
jgi:probable rRNA maturation factor